MVNFTFEDKKDLYNYITKQLDIFHYKYKLIEYMDELEVLKKEKYFMSANYLGINSLLIFVKINDKYYSVLIDRKTIARPNINIEDISLIPFNIRLNKSIYDGSILDGISMVNKATKERVFLATDIYYLRGKDLRQDSLKNKLLNLGVYLKNVLNESQNESNQRGAKIEINKIYKFSELDKLDEDMNRSSYYEFKGYSFYPEVSGLKLVLLNSNTEAPVNKNMFNKNVIINPEEINLIQESSGNKPNLQNKEVLNNFKSNLPEINNIKNTTSTTITIKYYPKTEERIFATLEMRKTVYTEVYTLHYLIVDQSNGLKVYKIKTLGNAYIPDQECSLMCKNIIGSKKNDKALMRCEFNINKNKWVPLHEEKENKFPNTLQEIEKYIDIIFEEEEQ